MSEKLVRTKWATTTRKVVNPWSDVAATSVSGIDLHFPDLQYHGFKQLFASPTCICYYILRTRICMGPCSSECSRKCNYGIYCCPPETARGSLWIITRSAFFNPSCQLPLTKRWQGMIKWLERDKGVKRLFLNEFMTSPACEISYKICLIIFARQGIIHLPL
jgi:hypothetical protein